MSRTTIYRKPGKFERRKIRRARIAAKHAYLAGV